VVMFCEGFYTHSHFPWSSMIDHLSLPFFFSKRMCSDSSGTDADQRVHFSEAISYFKTCFCVGCPLFVKSKAREEL
jgi:hypothetical protein